MATKEAQSNFFDLVDAAQPTRPDTAKITTTQEPKVEYKQAKLPQPTPQRRIGPSIKEIEENHEDLASPYRR